MREGRLAQSRFIDTDLSFIQSALTACLTAILSYRPPSPAPGSPGLSLQFKLNSSL